MNDIQAFATYPLTPEGSEFSSSDIASGIDSHKKSLIALIPRLRSLQHSTLVHRLQHAQSGLHVKFCLEKSPQQSLPLLNKRQTGKVMSPSFESEVQEIVQKRSEIGEQLIEAVSPVTNPMDDRHIQALRKLLTRRARGDEGAFPLEIGVPNAALDGVARIQALSTMAIAVVKVKRNISCTSVQVDVAAWLDQTLHNLSPNRQKNVTMKLPKKYQTLETGERLLTAMHKKMTLTLDVVVRRTWSTGGIHDLELLGFH